MKDEIGNEVKKGDTAIIVINNRPHVGVVTEINEASMLRPLNKEQGMKLMGNVVVNVNLNSNEFPNRPGYCIGLFVCKTPKEEPTA